MAGWLFVPNRKYSVCNVPGFNYIDLVNKRYSNDSCRKPKIETVYECKTPCSCCLLFYSKIVPCQLHLHYEAEETRHSPSSYKQSPFSYGLCSHLSPLQWNPELSSPKRSYKGSSADIWTIVFHWPVSDNQRKMLNVLLQWMQRMENLVLKLLLLVLLLQLSLLLSWPFGVTCPASAFTMPIQSFLCSLRPEMKASTSSRGYNLNLRSQHIP